MWFVQFLKIDVLDVEKNAIIASGTRNIRLHALTF